MVPRASNPIRKDFSKHFHEIEFKFCPAKIILTNESRKEISQMSTVTGSEVYTEHKHAHLSLKVRPYGQDMLNNISKFWLIRLPN